MSPPSRLQAKKPLLEAEALSLDDWLSHVLVPKHKRKFNITDFQFPTDQHRDAFLETIHNYPELQVRTLLRSFLIPHGTLGMDKSTRHWATNRSPTELLHIIEEHEFIRRLIYPPFLPWEGMTWVLDLLPHHPAKALDVLGAFFLAHGQFLPDGRIQGLIDAEAIIRSRYLDCDNPRESLLSLRPDEFEYLIGALYEKMGYEVLVTQASRDGGIDIEARQNDPGGRGFVLIQCKRYKDVIRVPAVRELMGVVARKQANKGVIVATCGFTAPARQEAAESTMIELLDFSSLNKLLNRYIGAKWPNHISYEIRRLQMTTAKKHGIQNSTTSSLDL